MSEKRSAGRPSTYTEELSDRIIESFWSGECRSITSLSVERSAPSRSTIFRWREQYPEFTQALFEARIAAADLYVDDNDQIITKMLAGEYEPAAANVAIN